MAFHIPRTMEHLKPVVGMPKALLQTIYIVFIRDCYPINETEAGKIVRDPSLFSKAFEIAKSNCMRNFSISFEDWVQEFAKKYEGYPVFTAEEVATLTPETEPKNTSR